MPEPILLFQGSFRQLEGESSPLQIEIFHYTPLMVRVRAFYGNSAEIKDDGEFMDKSKVGEFIQDYLDNK